MKKIVPGKYGMILKVLSDHNIMSSVCNNSGGVLETEVVIGSSIFISLFVYLVSMLGIKPRFCTC